MQRSRGDVSCAIERRPRVQGAYIMPPFDRVDSALEILKVLR